MAGDRPTFEGSTTRVWFLTTGEDSDGAMHEQRVEYRAGSPFPPMHHHPSQDERFVVERGAMCFEVAGTRHVVTAGSAIDVPRGAPHRARNASATEPSVVRWETRPALRTTAFFTAANRLGDGASLLDGALLAWTYRDVFRLDGPARFAVPVLGLAARLLGRRLP